MESERKEREWKEQGRRPLLTMCHESLKVESIVAYCLAPDRGTILSARLSFGWLCSSSFA
jgi:hypothetical protein